MATVGLKNLYYAPLLTDVAANGTITGGATYETPKRIAGAIKVDINPTVNKNTLHADDGPFATAVSMSEISVSIDVADIPEEDEAALLGHTYDSTTGKIIYKTSDSPPDVALLAESEKHDGGIRCFKLLKGKFTDSQETMNTKNDNPEYTIRTLDGSFVGRTYDRAWKEVKNFPKGADTTSWYANV
jgi:phi13 family phage major tail protein